MNVLRKSILIGFTVLGMAAAHAQDASATAGSHDAGARKEHMQAKMADMFAKRQARLHDLLKLTAQQESAWATYQAAIKPAPMSGTPPERGAFAKLPAPERMAKMLDFSKQRQAKMEAHLSALTAFYSQLTPEQKATFDDRTMGGKHGGGPRGHRGGWGGHHG
ncbi:Spy/CpxP family protein refolding chaperone [Duganella sp. CT11-25]|jgi:Spy/CpxP family protein refolding chaperone|uniref:Spy/CpxP family protein refolding chaperone n=1 Tax=unclassified Duganella TaxID=2636909 RepID=UPI0039AEF051